MENIIKNLKIIFDYQTIFVFLLGLLTFLLTLLIDWLSPKRELKEKNWYVRELIYTLISILLGMLTCIAFETSQSVIYIVGILMGLIGSTIIRKFISKREELADKVIDKVEDKISN